MKATVFALAVVLVVGVTCGQDVLAQADDNVSVLAGAEAGATVAELTAELALRDKTIAEKDVALRELQAAFDGIAADFRKKAEALQPTGDERLTRERNEALVARDAALKARDEGAAELAAARAETAAARAETAVVRTELETAQAEVRRTQAELAELRVKYDTVETGLATERAALNDAVAATKADRITLAYNIGCVYKATRQYARAEAEFMKALELAPNDPLIHFNLGVLYDDDLGNAAKARTHYERFLELAPDDPDVPKVTQWLSEL